MFQRDIHNNLASALYRLTG